MSRRAILIVAALLAVQSIVLIAYFVTEREREAESRSSRITDTTPPQPVSGRISKFVVTNRAGESIDLAALERPTIVHIWGTWCPPCLDELPELLVWAESSEFDIIAVALDKSWTQVDAFPGARSNTVVLGSADDAESQLNVRSLPATFLVGPSGELLLHADGARDWTDPTFRAVWRRR